MRFRQLAIGTTIALFAVAFLLPIKAVQNIRNDMAYDAVVTDKRNVARLIYKVGAWQNDPLAANNFHVLNYRRAIDGKGYSKKRRKKVAELAKKSFEKHMANGFAPAAYNRGMFNYKCSTKSSCYGLAIAHFEQGAKLGDKMSHDAHSFMLAKKLNKDARYYKIKTIADDGNAWAAYRYARNLRHDNTKLRRLGEPYALMAAEAGFADAQNFLGSYFNRRKDSDAWLEKAANNPVNRSLMASAELAERTKKRGDFVAARGWLELTIKPRADFDYTLVIEPQGLRWRNFQGSRNADANTSQKAAYDLALMQLSGQGGAVDKAAAIKNLKYADHWADAKRKLAKLQAGH